MTEQEKQLVEWLADMNEDDALRRSPRRCCSRKAPNPLRVLELCREAMDIVGKRFEEGEYFLPELVLAGEMLETYRRHRQAADQAGARRRAEKTCQGADRHGARRPARHRQEHRHLHARHQRLRGEGHRHRRAGARPSSTRSSLPARRGRPVRLSHARLRLDEGDDRGHSRTPGCATSSRS